MIQWNKAQKIKLTECVRMIVQRKGTKAREFRLCPVGGAGHGAQLQVLTPGGGDGSKPLIVGDVRKACRLTWPLITYEKDYSSEAMASIRELHGAKKRKRR
jgi:hypothetical protein